MDGAKYDEVIQGLVTGDIKFWYTTFLAKPKPVLGKGRGKKYFALAVDRRS